MFSPIGTGIRLEDASKRYVHRLNKALDRRKAPGDDFDRLYSIFLELAKFYYVGDLESPTYVKGRFITDSEAKDIFQSLYYNDFGRRLTLAETQRFIKQWKEDMNRDIILR